MNSQKNTKGFTIIEVVLVLAIAGLIFLMVFIALPALQRNQRDTAKKQEISTVLAQVTSYQSNNRGTSPATDATAKQKFVQYLEGKWESPNIILNSGTVVSLGQFATGSTPSDPEDYDTMVVVVGAKCATGSTATTTIEKGTARQSAAMMRLENSDAIYCQTN